jgi:hypothetical protein
MGSLLTKAETSKIESCSVVSLPALEKQENLPAVFSGRRFAKTSA